MLKREKYIWDSISRSLQKWVGISSVLGSILWVLFGVVDFYRDEFLRESYIYRIIIVSELLVLSFINNLKRNIKFQHLVTAIGILSSAIINQIISLKLAGAGSPYYVGLILIIIVAIGLLPINIYFAFTLAISIWLVYLLPILAFFKIPSMADFITSNVYLLCAISITLTWRYLANKSMVNELSLQYQLENDKDHLDQLVQERTADLNKSEQWHRSIFENSNDGILILAKDGVIANANDMACKIYHMTRGKLIGMPVGNLFTDQQRDDVALFFHKMLRVKSIAFEMPYTVDNAKTLFLEIGIQDIRIGEEHYILMVSRNVTEKKMYQEQLSQAQKMESIATFAGGIAHDVRNIITSMIAYIEIVGNDKGVSERTLQRTTLLDKSIRNAGNMISQLLSFARKSKSTLVETGVNGVVRDTLNIIKASIGENIEIVHDLCQNDLIIRANVNQIESAIMNLVFNARDAMPEGGRINISTEITAINHKEDAVVIPEGRYVVLAVSDTGVGIPFEAQRRIFEPFFTTKNQSKGTGLGLAMVYSIVADHKGHITVESEPGKGSKFKIYFPLVAERRFPEKKSEIPQESTIEISNRKNNPLPEKTGTILFVDDDEALMTMMSDALQDRGYEVISTTSPEEAVRIFQRNSETIILLITDMAMPRMGGADLVKRVRAIKPGMKVIIISAFNHEKIDQVLNDINVSESLHKPFAPSEFVAAVRSVLDSDRKIGDRGSPAVI